MQPDPISWQDHIPSKQVHNQGKMLSIKGAILVESGNSNSFNHATTKKEGTFSRVQWPLWDAAVKHKFITEETLPASPSLETLGESQISFSIRMAEGSRCARACWASTDVI